MTEVTVTLPRALSPYTINKLREDPTTACADLEKMNEHIGWLLAAWEIIMGDLVLDAGEARHRLQELEDLWWPVAKAARENFDIPLGEGISAFVIRVLEKHSEKHPQEKRA